MQELVGNRWVFVGKVIARRRRNITAAAQNVARRPPLPPGRFFVYGNHMTHYTLNGTPVTDEQIQVWADEAETGYDLQALPAPRRGRPPIGEGPGTVVPVRLDQETLSALLEKAESEGITTRSEAIRTAVRQWTQGPHVA